MVTRRILAGLLLVSLCGPVAASLATQAAGSTCSMCARACCCALKVASGPCRLDRPCGRDAAPEATVRLILEQNALVAVAEELLPFGGTGLVAPAATVTVLDPVRLPLVPPPRVSL